MPANDPINCFLSCSIRPRDRPLVDALERRVLRPMGFRCLTVGRNIAFPSQADDAVKEVLRTCECLVGLATGRYRANDVDDPNTSLTLAAPYLVQETSMAFERGLPFLIVRSGDVSIPGVTQRNLYLTIEEELSNGKLRFKAPQAVVTSVLQELKNRALVRRKAVRNAKATSTAGTAALWVGGAIGAYKLIDWLSRPPCFGEFYYLDSDCKACPEKARCKVEKQRLKG